MPADLIDLLTAAHRRLESLIAEVETAPTEEARRAALDAARAALDRHAGAERRFLHPALRQYLPAGPDIAAYQAAEHASFAALAPPALFDAVRLHLQEEETELFPRLRSACPPPELARLGALLESARVTD
ncbi:hemerythrin domain-containing protein [Dactylosporangium sp. CA-092794]|uniref:hemerythrin domain-containing protein n=1 Tax=Dactylosporangium sp. CA-092794 TaxID=3239929 RepID=UPI003D8B0067